jgi:tetratricopeptide (TPR) repeat protein
MISLKRNNLFESHYLALFFIIIYLIFSFIWHFSTNAPWDDDCVSRYFLIKNGFQNPAKLISPWTRPLFSIIFLIPFQLSKHMVLIMALISATSALALFKSCKILKIRNAALCVPLLLFQAFYFTISRSSLAEPLVSAILCFGLYFYLEKKYIGFAIVGSLIPLARLELSPFLVIWAYLLFKNTHWKYILILGVPTFLWNFAGFMMDGELLWLYESTLGKDTGSNRYGNTTFWHYFRRYIFVVGPVVFYFFTLGFLHKILKRNLSLLITIQFAVGFLIYVIFSWKLSLGQAAGFLRHLITLSPLAAIIALEGYNYWLRSIGGEKVSEESFKKDTKSEDLEQKEIQAIQEQINLIDLKEKDGKIKKRAARHQVNELKNKITLLQQAERETSSKKQNKAEKKSRNSLIVIFHGIALALIAYFFFSKELLIHHTLSKTDDYTLLIILSSILGVFLILRLFSKKQSVLLRNLVSSLLVISVMAFTLVTEPPNAHNSDEREAMTEISNLYFNSYLSERKTYVNHNWFFWEEDESIEGFEDVTVENLKNAPDSAIVIWESHYSHRLRGDVTETYIQTNPEFLELVKITSPKFNFNAKIYQKIPKGTPSEERLKIQSRFIESFPTLSEAYVSRAMTKSNVKRYDEAFEDYNKAIKMDSNNYICFIERGNLYFKLNKFNEAAQDFKASTTINAESYLGYYNAALSYARLNQVDTALVYINKAIEKNAKQANSFIQRGTIYFKKGNFSAALNDFSKVVELDPKNQLAYFNRGIAKIKLSRNDEACEDLRAAQNLGYQQATNVIRQYCSTGPMKK